MTRGTYNIQGGSPTSGPRTDTSFKAFICALLVFAVICLVIFLVMFKWKGDRDDSGGIRREAVGQGTTESPNSISTTIRGFSTIESQNNSVIVDGSHITNIPDDTDNDSSTVGSSSTTEIPNSIENDHSVVDHTRIYNTTEIPDVTENDSSIVSSSSTTEILGAMENGSSTVDSMENDYSTVGSPSTTEIIDGIENDYSAVSSSSTTEIPYSMENDYSTVGSPSTTEIIDGIENDYSAVSSSSTTEIPYSMENDYSTVGSPSTTDIMDGIKNDYSAVSSSSTTEIPYSMENDYSSVDSSSTTEIQDSIDTNTTRFTTTQISNSMENVSTTIGDSSSTEIPIYGMHNYSTTVDDSDIITEIEGSTEMNDSTFDGGSTTAQIPTRIESYSTTERSSSSTIENSSPVTVVPLISRITAHNESASLFCNSPVCKKASCRMLALTDYAKDYCEDFYGYACGGVDFFRDEESAESILSTYLNDEIIRSFNLTIFEEFKTSCVQHQDSLNSMDQTNKIVEDMLDEVGKFEFSTSVPHDFSFYAKLIQRQAMPLFEIGLGVDPVTKQIVLQLTLPEESALPIGVKGLTGLSQHRNLCLKKIRRKYLHPSSSSVDLNEVYNSYLNCSQHYADYLNNIEVVLRSLEVFRALPKDVADSQIKEIRFDMEFNILNYLKDKLSASPSGRKYVLQSVDDLDIDYNFGIKWSVLLEPIIGRKPAGSERIHVYYGEHFNKMFESLNFIEFRKIKNALLAVYAYDVYLNSQPTYGSSDSNEYCLDLSLKLMPDIRAYLSSEVLSSQEDRKKWSGILNQKFEFLKSKMIEAINDDQNSGVKHADDRKTLQEICSKLKLLLYTETDSYQLSQNYDKIVVSKDFPKNLITLLVKSRKDSWSLVGKPANDSRIFERFLNPMSTEPLLIRPVRIIAFPFGLIKRVPDDLPEYLKAARIDFHLAKAIGTFFDPTEMANMPQEFHDTYNSLVDPENSYTRNFAKTSITYDISNFDQTSRISEKIAGNAGFRLISSIVNLTIDAGEILPWIDNINNTDIIGFKMKQFYVAVAQEYCKRESLSDFMLAVFERDQLPAPLTVENLVKNCESFANTFGCKPGSPMNPPMRVQSFPYYKAQDTSFEEYYGSAGDIP